MRDVCWLSHQRCWVTAVQGLGIHEVCFTEMESFLSVLAHAPLLSLLLFSSSRTTPIGQFLLAPALALHGYEVAPCVCVLSRAVMPNSFGPYGL